MSTTPTLDRMIRRENTRLRRRVRELEAQRDRLAALIEPHLPRIPHYQRQHLRRAVQAVQQIQARRRSGPRRPRVEQRASYLLTEPAWVCEAIRPGGLIGLTPPPRRSRA